MPKPNSDVNDVPHSELSPARKSAPFLRKLELGALLWQEDRDGVERLLERCESLPARQTIVEEGDRPEYVNVVLSGVACRSKSQPDGKRQIVDILLAGDCCHLHSTVLVRADHSISTLSACVVARIPHGDIDRLIARSSAIARALWWTTLVSDSIAREWMVNLGKRPAEKRLAHLFCELFVRLRAVGEVNGNSFSFPILQQDLADTLGMTFVHVNRMIQALRAEGLIVLRNSRMTITDLPRLASFAGFSPDYLHLPKGAARIV